MLQRIKEVGIVSVIRAASHEEALGYVDASVKGGIIAVELTYSIPNLPPLLEKVVKEYPQAIVGVGSVLNKQMALDAINAGVAFVVSPGFSDEVNEICHEKGITYLPGCMTVTEVMNAMNKGNKMIKLFPGELFGQGYIKAIKAPIPHVEIMPTGGVTVDNVQEWFKAGVSCVGVGSSLFKSGDLTVIENLAKEFVKKIEDVRK